MATSLQGLRVAILDLHAFNREVLKRFAQAR